MYKPMRFFTTLGCFPFIIGVGLGIRYIVLLCMGSGQGNIQSLILCSMLILIGVMTWVVGLLADVMAANRKILQEIQQKVRDIEYKVDHK